MMEARPLPQTGHAARARAAFATGTLSTVGNGSAHPAGIALPVRSHADRPDLDDVEHVRQDRLKRWQTPPDPTRKASS